MICDTCGVTEAAFLLGNLATGEQLAFCGPDFLRFGLDAAKAGLDPAEILSVLGIEAAGVKVDGKAAKSKAPKSPPEPEPKPEPESTPEPAPGSPEMATTPTDE